MRFRAFIDGAARGNPGPAGAGVYVSAEENLPAEEHFEALGHQTNNVAEYRALLLALKRAAERGASEVSIASDSLLLVQQMLGRYRVKAPNLQPLFAEGAPAREGIPPLLDQPRAARGQQEGRPARQPRRRRERARHGRGRHPGAMTPEAGTIAQRREDVLAEIARAASRAGRHPGEVTLMAVTKTQSAETVALAARAGIVRFGENRVQEGAAKIAALRADFPGLEWRLIGPLQSNKARTALQWFGVVETLDRERLAARLEAMLAETGRNAAGAAGAQSGRRGVQGGSPARRRRRLCEAALDCIHLEVRGLMAVPPYDPDPEKSRPYFRRLAGIRDGLVRRFGRPLPGALDGDEPRLRRRGRRGRDGGAGRDRAVRTEAQRDGAS